MLFTASTTRGSNVRKASLLSLSVLLPGLLLLLPRPLRADEAEEARAKLRSLVRLPAMSTSPTFKYSTDHGFRFVINETETEVEDTADSIRKKMHGDASDASLYLELGTLYSNKPVPQKVEANAAWEKSLALFQEQLKSKPRDAKTLTELATVYHQMQRKPERDQTIAEATAQSPRSSEIWETRATVAFADAVTALNGQMENIYLTITPFRMATLLQEKYDSTRLTTALHYLEQARECYNKAVAVAPKDSRVYGERWMLQITFQDETALLQQALQGHSVTAEELNTLQAQFVQQCFSSEALPDLLQAANRSPEDPFASGTIAFVVLLGKKSRNPNAVDAEQYGALKRLSTQHQKLVEQMLARMETLSHSKDPTLAGKSALALGFNQMLLLSPAEGRTTLLRAQTLLPRDPRVIECLALSYTMEKKRDEVLQLLQEALKTQKSTRWHLVLSLLESRNGSWDEAEGNIRTALKEDPESFDANTALCAVLLHSATDMEKFKNAVAQCQHTQKLVPPSPTSDQRFNFNYLAAIMFSINGNSVEARKLLQDLDGSGDQKKDIKEVLALLPPDPEPPH